MRKLARLRTRLHRLMNIGIFSVNMLLSWWETFFSISGPLWGESMGCQWILLAKASDAGTDLRRTWLTRWMIVELPDTVSVMMNDFCHFYVGAWDSMGTVAWSNNKLDGINKISISLLCWKDNNSQTIRFPNIHTVVHWGGRHTCHVILDISRSPQNV